ncbi:MAG: ATP-binding cassette, subfamily bacterial [Frankiales bacterium]|jgi:ATP-binding cassette subfamily B protein|nr:ATP-binding cassette, subfamily bacterial [Frankiales bacterium]
MAMGMGGGGMGRVMLGGGVGGGMGHPGGRTDEKVPMPDKAVVKRVGRLFGPYKRDVSIVALTILVTSALGVLSPLLIKPIFDKGLFPKGGPNIGLLSWLVGAMVAIAVVSSVIGVYQSYLTNVVGQRVMRDLRATLYEHLQGLSLRFFTSTKTGEIQSRLANDVGGLQSVITDTASTILGNSVILISTLVAMFVLSWKLSVLSLVLLPLFILLTRTVGRRRRKVAAETQIALAEMSATTEETLSVSGVLLSKVFGRQAGESERYREQNERLAKLQVRQQIIGRSFFAVVSTFFSITPAAVYLVAGLTSRHGGGLSSGTLVAFTTLQTRLFLPMGQLLQTSTEVSSSLALFDRVFHYLDMEPDIVDSPAAREPQQPVRGAVSLRDVWFSYETGPAGVTDTDESHSEAAVEEAEELVAAAASGVSPAHLVQPQESGRRWALRGVDLEIEPGQLAAIVGPSGAGKTTISYLVPRLYDVTRGGVLLDGVDVRDLTLASMSDTVGMVTQESYLFHASVRDNLSYSKPEATDEEIEAAARAAQIHDRIMEFDKGYDTIVGERGYRLSGGEKQRIAIARVILKDPRVLILDEATSALDTANERLVQAALQPLMAGRTTIAIAHRLSTIRAADVIFVLDRGLVAERGTHEELLAQGGLYASLYEQQYGGGLVEATCEDGVVLSDGHVLHMAPAQTGPGREAPADR